MKTRPQTSGRMLLSARGTAISFTPASALFVTVSWYVWLELMGRMPKLGRAPYPVVLVTQWLGITNVLGTWRWRGCRAQRSRSNLLWW